jgi:hypothetical protein
VFVAADLPSAELRSLAQTNIDLFGRSVMAEQLNAGRDLHLWFGAQILGLSYEQALEKADDKRMKGARQAAKPCNFGFPGGMGVANFIGYAYCTYKVKFEHAEAERLKRVWLDAFPEMAHYFRHVDGLFKGRDRALIRHPRTGFWRGRVTYCAACNFHFQHLTAVASALGLTEVQRRAYAMKGSALFGSRTLLYTHDEIVLETPRELAHDAGMELSAVYAERFTELHPDVPALPCKGPTKDPRVIMPAVSMIYSKDLKTVWGPDGRLAEWAPKELA